MKKLTTGKLANALKALNPNINRQMVGNWVKGGKIKADQNPGTKQGWYILDHESVLDFILREFQHYDPSNVRQALKSLGLLK